MKPALSPTTTGVLPSCAARDFTSSMTFWSVTTVRITSTSFWTGAGLKKCMPTTWAGRVVATEISVTDKDEVLVARIACGARILSRVASVACLRSRCSGMASTTSSTSARSSSDVVNVIRSKIASFSSSVSLPRFTARAVDDSR